MFGLGLVYLQQRLLNQFQSAFKHPDFSRSVGVLLIALPMLGDEQSWVKSFFAVFLIVSRVELAA
jgi:hypothetical protein